MTWLLVVVGLGCCTQAAEIPAHGSREVRWQLLRSPEAKAEPQTDAWLAYDKVQHLTFSFLWTLSSQYALEQKAGWATGRALPLAAGTSAAIGLAKELYDWKVGPRRRFSYRDLVADGVGIVLAIGFIMW